MNVERMGVVPGAEYAVSFQMTRPDDWHLHFRQGKGLRDVIGHSVRQMGRGLVMPNLVPPVKTVARAEEYETEIRAALPPGSQFEPVMMLYVTDDMSSDEIVRASESPTVRAIKMYPANATTNSAEGVTDINKAMPALEKAAELGVVICLHGEVVDPTIDYFDREAVYVDRVLHGLVEHLSQAPKCKIVVEHLSTSRGVEFVAAASAKVAGTITAHHLIANRNSLFDGGIRPHHFCLPVLKKETDRIALLRAAMSDSPKFFFGSDSAPHPQSKKECSCGAGGCYTAFAATELVATAFDRYDEWTGLEKLEPFMSHRGADFYGFERNTDTVRFIRKEWSVPAEFAFGAEKVIPFYAGKVLQWQML